MRWLNFNGINARGFFNLFTKQPNRTFPSQIAAGNGGVLMAGFFLEPTTESKTATRFSVLFEALAQVVKDNLVSGNRAEMATVIWITGRFVAFDFDGNCYESTNGVDFTAASNPSGDFPGGAYQIAFDDTNNTVVYSGFNEASAVYVSDNVTPLSFSDAIEVDAALVGAIASRPGSGVLVLLGGGRNGGTNPNVWQSTDGGNTWAMIGAQPFENCGEGLLYGTTQYLAMGSLGTGGPIVQYSLSTDDGATWTPATSFPGPGNSAVVAAMATDGAGNWVVIGGSDPPDNYWVSSDDGTTFTSPNLFDPSLQDGSAPGLLVWDGHKWCAVWSNADDSADFVSVSNDGGNTWDVGPTIIDTP